MVNMDIGRILRAGLAAGALINISEFVLNEKVLKSQWMAAMTALNKPAEPAGSAIAGFVVVGFLTGIFSVWLYAAIRPRYGPGPRTAFIAGSAVWILGYLLAIAPPFLLDVIPAQLVVTTLIWTIPEVLLATLLGAKLYKEEPLATEQLAAAASR